MDQQVLSVEGSRPLTKQAITYRAAAGSPEPVKQRRPPWTRPDAVVPRSVPAEVVLIRTERVAVAAGSVRAYPNGFEFTLHWRLRREYETTGLGGDPLGRHRRGAGASDDMLRLVSCSPTPQDSNYRWAPAA